MLPCGGSEEWRATRKQHQDAALGLPAHQQRYKLLGQAKSVCMKQANAQGCRSSQVAAVGTVGPRLAASVHLPFSPFLKLWPNAQTN